MADKEKKYSDIDLSKYAGGFTGSNALTQAGTNKQNAETAYAEAVASGFIGSDALTQAGTNKQNAANAYSDYVGKGFSSQKQGLADSVLYKYLYRDPFSYDFNADALYQQYKDKYIQQGQMAMQDTMGQAAAMTGGYGNSYAATVGNQAYQAQLNNLNDIIPELYKLAYDKYNQEGQNMINQYSMLGNAIDREYGIWGDKANMLMADRDYYGQEESNLYNREYGAWGDKMNLLAADRDYYGQEESNLYNREYGAWGDQRNYDTTQYWNETNYGYQKERDAVADSQWQKEYDALYGGTNGSGSGGTGGGAYDNAGYSTKAVKEAQDFVGADVDGMWGSQSAAKAKAMGYNSIEDVMKAIGIKHDVNVNQGTWDTFDADSADKEEKDQYAGWGVSEWEAYFAHIRQSEGQSAAETELNRMTQAGLIPQNMVTAAALGARGGRLGH